MLSVYVCVCVCVCVCFVYLHQHYLKNLVLQHQINRYMTFTSELFLKIKDIVESNFLISVNYGQNLKKRAGGVRTIGVFYRFPLPAMTILK